MRVSSAVPGWMACVRLALELDVSDEALAAVERTTDTDYHEEVCHTMLLSWWHTQQPQSLPLLFHALCTSEMASIAEECKAVLLAGGKIHYITTL